MKVELKNLNKIDRFLPKFDSVEEMLSQLVLGQFFAENGQKENIITNPFITKGEVFKLNLRSYYPVQLQKTSDSDILEFTLTENKTPSIWVFLKDTEILGWLFDGELGKVGHITKHVNMQHTLLRTKAPITFQVLQKDLRNPLTVF